MKLARGWIAALLKKLASFGLFASLCVSANAQVPKPSEKNVIKAVMDCATATSQSGVDEAALRQAGWREATTTSEEVTGSPLKFFGKSDNHPVVLVSLANDSANAGCSMTGRLSKLSAFKKLREAFDATFASAGNDEGKYYYRIGADVVMLSQTGSRRKPAFRATVLELGEAN